MAAEISRYLDLLTGGSHARESEVVARALRVGLRQLWRDWLLAQYVRGEITRAEAVDAVGIDWVELVERQRSVVLEDLRWAESD